MNNAELRAFLKNRLACKAGMDWLGKRDSSQMWAECKRPDWLLWWAGQVVSRQELVLAACDCAETALRYVPEGEDRPRLAIETARRWARGEADVQEVRAARAAAGYAAAAAAVDAAAYAVYAAAVAADAADAAARAAAGYAAAAAAVDAAAYAVYAAAAAADAADAGAAAAYAATYAAEAAANATMCQLIRSRWPECPVPEEA